MNCVVWVVVMWFVIVCRSWGKKGLRCFWLVFLISFVVRLLIFEVELFLMFVLSSLLMMCRYILRLDCLLVFC